MCEDPPITSIIRKDIYLILSLTLSIAYLLLIILAYPSSGDSIESRFGLQCAFSSRRNRGSFIMTEMRKNKKIFAIENVVLNLLLYTESVIHTILVREVDWTSEYKNYLLSILYAHFKLVGEVVCLLSICRSIWL